MDQFTINRGFANFTRKFIDESKEFLAVFFDETQAVGPGKAVPPRLVEFSVGRVDQDARHCLGEHHDTPVAQHRRGVGPAVVPTGRIVGDAGPVVVPTVLEVAFADLHGS